MAYLGLKPSTSSFNVDTYSGDSSTVDYTLSRAPASVNSIIVHVDGLILNPSKYALSGTTLSFLSAPGVGVDNVEVLHLGVRTEGMQPADASVGLKQLSAEVTNILTRKNVIINGNFDIWQRGSTQTISGYGSVDRFASLVSGSSQSVSKRVFTLGQIDVPNEPEAYYRNVVASIVGAGNFTSMVQRIEGVRTLAGKTVTISFWAKADAAKSIALEFIQNFGTGGTPSAEVNSIGNTTFNLITSWQKFTTTVTLPSISGKTLGTINGNDFLGANLWFDAGSNFDLRTGALGNQSGTFDIAQMQLEEGSFASGFERRHIADENILCKRYYEELVGVTINDNATIWTGSYVSFNTLKRSPPTISLFSNVSNTPNNASVNNAVGDAVSALVAYLYESGIGLKVETVGNGAPTMYTVKILADSEL